jgi:hypothetical protein
VFLGVQLARETPHDVFKSLIIRTSSGIITSYGRPPPTSKLARGKDELVLAEVEIFKTSVPALLRKLGKPTERREVSPATEDIVGERLYVWKKPNVTVQVGTMFATKRIFKGGLAETPYYISVDGSDGVIGKTGRGLKLGDSYSSIATTYGSRYVKKGRRATIQWETTTELEVGWNEKGIINHIELFGPE